MSIRNTTLHIGIAFTTFGFIQSCSSPEPQNYHSKGHYEDFSEDLLTSFKNQYRILPEFGSEKEVIVSRKTISLQGPQLIFALLKAGAEKIYIQLESNMEWYEDSELFKLKREIERQKMAWDKIEFIKHQRPGWQSIWARDWGPVALNDADGQLALADFNYDPFSKADDATPSEFAKRIQVPRLSLPLYLEGGNMMSDGNGSCFVSEVALKANQKKQKEEDQTFTESEFKQLLSDYLGCESTELLDAMPYEPTGHIDMWMKFIDSEQVLVSRLDDKTIETVAAEEKQQAIEIQSFLNAKANRLRELGYQVITIPLPAPLIEKGTIRSYVNSLYLGETLILPKYISGQFFPVTSPHRPTAFDYPDQHLLSQMEKEVETTLKSVIVNGKELNISWVESDYLIGKHGAIHCATMQLPSTHPTL